MNSLQPAIWLSLALALTACSQAYDASNHAAEEFDPIYLASNELSTPDLRHYELVGPVKSCHRTTYFDVTRTDGKLEVDTTGTNTVEVTAYFDEIGGYVPKADERVTRDEAGRIARWEDRHPNYPSIHPGFLRDRLDYEYIDDNHFLAKGMGATTMVVTDRFGNILGQHSISTNPHYVNLASNVYRRYDKHGNWTERLTIWTTKVGNDSTHRTNYSIDKRKIVYY